MLVTGQFVLKDVSYVSARSGEHMFVQKLTVQLFDDSNANQELFRVSFWAFSAQIPYNSSRWKLFLTTNWPETPAHHRSRSSGALRIEASCSR
jgi:hypothetical protein